MNDNEKQYFEDILSKAAHSSNLKIGDLIIDITKEVTEAVRDQIQITVNGKIDNIKEHLNEQDVKIEELLKSTQEVIDTYNDGKGFFTILKKTAMFIIPVAGAWAIIANVWKR